jgi:hypothetical protein
MRFDWMITNDKLCINRKVMIMTYFKFLFQSSPGGIESFRKSQSHNSRFAYWNWKYARTDNNWTATSLLLKLIHLTGPCETDLTFILCYPMYRSIVSLIERFVSLTTGSTGEERVIKETNMSIFTKETELKGDRSGLMGSCVWNEMDLSALAWLCFMVYFMALSVSRLCSIERLDDWEMMNYQGFGRKRSWYNRVTIPAFAWIVWE